MAFDDIFREREVIEPDDVYKMCGIRRRAEVYNLVGFGDAMTAWKEKAALVGTTIIPRQVYLTRVFEQHEHRVAWVYRSERHEDDIEDYHHIACDCVSSMEDPDEQMDEIATCPAVLTALEHRAARVSEVLRTKGVFEFFGKPEGRLDPKPHAIKTTKAMVNFLMNYEQAHPEGWVANTVSGEHQVPLLATIMQIRPYPDPEDEERLSMQSIIEEMHYDGSLELQEDGLTVTLPEAA